MGKKNEDMTNDVGSATVDSTPEPASRYRRGQSTLHPPVPGVDENFGDVRRRHDPSSLSGLGAQITLLFPFVPRGRSSADEHRHLHRVLGQEPTRRLACSAVATFPGIVYLRLGDDVDVVNLFAGYNGPGLISPDTEASTERSFLMLANAVDRRTQAAIVAEVQNRLPIQVEVDRGELAVVAERWETVSSFRFGGDQTCVQSATDCRASADRSGG
ncbi:MAG TPA: hypothetical protein VF533_05605 [Solirubrobacteraceae bacterium]|jgi:hypothetical protein